MAGTPEEVKAFLARKTEEYLSAPGSYLEITKNVRGAITGWLNQHMAGDTNRRLSLGWLFLPVESKLREIHARELGDGHWYALYQWIGFWKDADNEWNSNEEFPTEAALVVGTAMYEFSRLTLADQKLASELDPLDMAVTGSLFPGAELFRAQDGYPDEVVDGLIAANREDQETAPLRARPANVPPKLPAPAPQTRLPHWLAKGDEPDVNF